jgi:uncharacterized protein YndB with AHSA1/START domain
MLITQPVHADRVITVSLECRAPKRKVFETWTEPEWLKKWFRADEGYVCNVAEVDLKPGGRFRLAMALPGQPETVFSGAYQAVAVPDALVYTWSGGEGDHVTLVTALFHDAGKGSRVDFTHGVFATAAARDAHAQGWMACWKQLERVLEG